MPEATIGIDVGKYQHEAALLDGSGKLLGRTVRFPNTREGFAKLTAALTQRLHDPEVAVAVEATGHYGQHVLRHLADLPGLSVRYVNPLLVKEYPQHTLRRVKTDRVDAVRIAQAARHISGNAWSPPPSFRTLTRLYRRLVRTQSRIKEELTNFLDQVCPEFSQYFPNMFLTTPLRLLAAYPDFRRWARLRTSTLRKLLARSSRRPWSDEQAVDLRDAVASSIGAAWRTDATVLALRLLLAQLTLLQEQITTVRAAVEEAVADDPRIPTLAALPGMSQFGGAVVLAELGSRSFRHSGQVAAAAGLDPSVEESGTYVRKRGNRISKRGSKYLRSQLFYAARTAMRTDPTLRAWAEEKRSSGKHYTLVVCAVARKLATRIFHALNALEQGETKTPPVGGLTDT